MHANWKISAVMVLALSFVGLAVAEAGKAKGDGTSGPGKVEIGVDASEWSSDTATDVPNGILPIGGSGQVNGEFITVERNGIQIGLRAQERFVGTIEADADKKVAVYEALTGESQAGTNRGTWNVDWHVDLRGAKGVAKGTTLDDYDLTLEFGEEGETASEFDLQFPGFPSGVVLYQSSQNPGFSWMSSSTGYDAFDEATYVVTLVLTPATFKGPVIRAVMRVVVSDA